MTGRILLVGAIAAAVTFVGTLPRLLLAAGTLPGPLRPFIWSDPLHIWERGVSAGRLPYWDAPFEYPPLTGYLFALPSALGTSALGQVAFWAVLQILAAAFVAGAIAATSRTRSLRWALAPQLALLGPLNFDLLAVAAMVAAVVLARRRAHVRAQVMLALGLGVKLFPLIAVPAVALAQLGAARPERVALGLAAFIAVAGALYAPSVGAPFSSLESITRYSTGVGPNFDSVWGIAAGAIDPLFPGSAGPLILLVTSAGLLVTYIAAVLPAALRSRDPAVPIGLAVATLLLWSRLYSPQFSLWLLPFLAMLPIASRTYRLLVLADVVVFLTVFPMTLVRWSEGDPLFTLLLAFMAAAVVARHAALIAAWRELRRLG